MVPILRLILVYTLICNLDSVLCGNKYSKEANEPLKKHFEEEPKFQIRDSDKPFRIYKLNLLWAKAKQVCT